MLFLGQHNISSHEGSKSTQCLSPIEYLSRLPLLLFFFANIFNKVSAEKVRVMKYMQMCKHQMGEDFLRKIMESIECSDFTTLL